ncbi:MAG: MotA/TolQ/ExbB proton channel family protein, partial [Eubacteriales bacterium]|nr:MotA/TolQ/ExbB proton channel family protein [Eubacteriales bacterium]
EKISDVLNNDIYIYETDRTTAISMFDSFAAFAPAFGMVGTIVGLIMTLQAGMESPDMVTKAIGVAFITTLYGVLLANSFFIPAATKLRARMTMYRLEKEMIIEAVCAIRNGINPRMLKEQLSSYYILGSKKQQQQQEKPLRGVKGSKAA